MKTIWLPSGDHDGFDPIARNAPVPPAASITYTAVPPSSDGAVNTRLDPSGDHDGFDPIARNAPVPPAASITYTAVPPSSDGAVNTRLDPSGDHDGVSPAAIHCPPEPSDSIRPRPRMQSGHRLATIPGYRPLPAMFLQIHRCQSDRSRRSLFLRLGQTS